MTYSTRGFRIVFIILFSSAVTLAATEPVRESVSKDLEVSPPNTLEMLYDLSDSLAEMNSSSAASKMEQESAPAGYPVLPAMPGPAERIGTSGEASGHGLWPVTEKRNAGAGMVENGFESEEKPQPAGMSWKAETETRVVDRPTAASGALADNDPATGGPRLIENQDVNRNAKQRHWPIQNLLPLATVLLLIALLVWIVKRFMPNRHLLGGGDVVNVVSRTMLAGKQSLVLTRVGRRLLLLGVSPERIDLLCEVDDPDEVAELMGKAASARPGSMTDQFERTFRDQSRGYMPARRGADLEADTEGQIRGLIEKVRQFKDRQVA